MKSYVLHRIKLIESFRMISKSSKSTDGNALKNNLTSTYPVVKLNTQGHFLEKFVLWFYICPGLPCNCEWPAAIGILPTILAQKSEAGCQAWRQELEEKKFRLFNTVSKSKRVIHCRNNGYFTILLGSDIIIYRIRRIE